MADIGRSIIATVFVLVVSQLALNQKIPVDMSNAGQLIVDLVILTGYIYACRTVVRLLLATIVFIVSSIGRFIKLVISRWTRSSETSWESNRRKEEASISSAFNYVYRAASLFRGEYMWGPADYDSFSFYGETLLSQRQRGLLQFLDRTAFVVIIVASTLPTLRQTFLSAGLAGLVLIAVLYVLTGRFSWFLKDAI